METPYKIAQDLYALPSYLDVPLLGLVPINAFVLRARDAVLIDTGTTQDSPRFLEALRSIIDPGDLKWIWLTHPDADHTGSIHSLLEQIPQLKVITTFLGFGIKGLSNPLPLERVRFLNPGETLSLGDRVLTAVTPPTFDNPATTGCFDSKSRAFFSADCFGAVLHAPAREARAIPAADLRQGQLLWESMDHPWIHKVDRARFAVELESIRRMAPDFILSAHLPPACGMTDPFLEMLGEAPDAAPYLGPDQRAMEHLLTH